MQQAEDLTPDMPRWVRKCTDLPESRLIHVNSSARGGGVAELLACLVDQQRQDGVNAGWAVVSGGAEFFHLTKEIHTLLHGVGEPAMLPVSESLYRSTLDPQGRWLAERVGPSDVVVLHDPQVLGLAPALSRAGVRVAWHCHIGSAPGADTPHRAVWDFLEPYLQFVDVVLVSHADFAPPRRTAENLRVVLPAIDPESPKNREQTSAETRSLLFGMGLLPGSAPGPGVLVEQDMPLPGGAPTVLQVSRWDPLKGMEQVLASIHSLPDDAHVVLAGPQPHEILDAPEGLDVLERVRRDRYGLPDRLRSRVHLVTLSMADVELNALRVNALQRRADVIVQRSRQEGFGLTVTEAMLKGRAVVASDVGGLRSQIHHGTNGLLIPSGGDDDGAVLAEAVSGLLVDARYRERLGAEAARSVARRFLVSRLADDYRTEVHPGLERTANV